MGCIANFFGKLYYRALMKDEEFTKKVHGVNKKIEDKQKEVDEAWRVAAEAFNKDPATIHIRECFVEFGDKDKGYEAYKERLAIMREFDVDYDTAAISHRNKTKLVVDQLRKKANEK